MANARVPVDLLNPGQVFACHGLVEAAQTLLGEVRAGFDWSDASQAWFQLNAPGDSDPVAAVLAFLAGAEVRALAPERSGVRVEKKWGVDTELVQSGHPFYYGEPRSSATLPAILRHAGVEIVVDHWGDATVRDSVKFWAGAQGKPGAAFLGEALELARTQLASAADDPFSVAAPQPSSFRLDWRRDYVPLGVGFSLNNHKSSMVPLGYPLVEVLGAIGLTHARPQRPNRRDKLVYRYRVGGATSMPAVLFRAVLGCADLPFPSRTFRVRLDWPGQENQARCITDITEET